MLFLNEGGKPAHAESAANHTMPTEYLSQLASTAIERYKDNPDEIKFWAKSLHALLVSGSKKIDDPYWGSGEWNNQKNGFLELRKQALRKYNSLRTHRIGKSLRANELSNLKRLVEAMDWIALKAGMKNNRTVQLMLSELHGLKSRVKTEEFDSEDIQMVSSFEKLLHKWKDADQSNPTLIFTQRLLEEVKNEVQAHTQFLEQVRSNFEKFLKQREEAFDTLVKKYSVGGVTQSPFTDPVNTTLSQIEEDLDLLSELLKSRQFEDNSLEAARQGLHTSKKIPDYILLEIKTKVREILSQDRQKYTALYNYLFRHPLHDEAFEDSGAAD